MNEQDLKQAILDYITTTYKANYTGYLNVIIDDNVYTLEIGLPSYMTRTYISGVFDSDQDFLDYIYEELRTRNYMKVYFYKVVRNDE